MNTDNAIANVEFRISLIWTQTFSDLLEDSGQVRPGSFLARPWEYVEKFDQLQVEVNQRPHRRSPTPPSGVHLPWERPWGDLFWTYYLGGTPPGEVGGVKAWNALVPFREKTVAANGKMSSPISVKAGWLEGTVFHETFLFPHGLSFVLNAHFRPWYVASLEHAVQRAFDVFGDKRFSVSLGESSASLAAKQVASTVLENARSRILGDATPRGSWNRDPFTVTTFRAAPVPLDAPPAKAVRAALGAVTSWRRGWSLDAPPTIDKDNCLGGRTDENAADVILAASRARAVWLPKLFTHRGKRALGCFHRNLTLLSMQVDSLAGLINLADERVQEGQELSVRMHECLSNALVVLDDLREGRRSTTYRSFSPEHQLQGASYNAMTALRELLN